MYAQRRNRLTTHFSESIPVVKQRVSVFVYRYLYRICGRILKHFLF